MNLMNNLKIGMRIYFIAILLNVLMMIIASIGIIKMGNIGNVLYDIAEIDIPLTRIITQMTVHQLEKAVYFERAMRNAAFLTDFQNHTARDSFNSAKESCVKQGRLFNENLEKAMKIPEHALQNAKNLQARQQFKDILDALKSINKEHHEVDKKMKKVFEMIDAKKLTGLNIKPIKLKMQKKTCFILLKNY
ncbi:MAG: hypothetical protein OMM_02521 [Candidatus Magnetoglobus multicellularis str. Araruama]|uniref:Chemotaxis methyl-accepting receptor HlyB-like 4HB MCP domain-containing protein n=1 Tax=Candidatus Magnetoglobus multicellularis str. Araruama TaxID=890399 RepID=A0A1V1P993_9BACT|nr:MAG: hypothetical protein OMM_02521 [Candidatus Magnetoglobus multicellularis str. Araruama]